MKKWGKTLFITAAFAVLGGMTSFAGEWKLRDGQWIYVNDDGSLAISTWIGNYYLGADGVMLTNTTTPDGYCVGADGAWIPEGRPVDTDPKEMYKQVLDDYAAARREALSGVGMDVLFERGYNVSEYWMWSLPNTANMRYAFADIDQNGTAELFIGVDGEVIDAFGYDGSKEVRLAELPGRGYLQLYENGILETYAHGGAASGIYEFYRMSPNGFTMDRVDILECNDDEYIRNDARITASEFQKLVDGYENSPKAELSWTPME